MSLFNCLKKDFQRSMSIVNYWLDFPKKSATSFNTLDISVDEIQQGVSDMDKYEKYLLLAIPIATDSNIGDLRAKIAQIQLDEADAVNALNKEEANKLKSSLKVLSKIQKKIEDEQKYRLKNYEKRSKELIKSIEKVKDLEALDEIKARAPLWLEVVQTNAGNNSNQPEQVQLDELLSKKALELIEQETDQTKLRRWVDYQNVNIGESWQSAAKKRAEEILARMNANNAAKAANNAAKAANNAAKAANNANIANTNSPNDAKVPTSPVNGEEISKEKTPQAWPWWVIAAISSAVLLTVLAIVLAIILLVAGRKVKSLESQYVSLPASAGMGQS